MSLFLTNARYQSAQSLRSAFILISLAAAGCGGNSSQTPAPAPSLISTFPLDAAVGVPVNAKLSATFDMAMDPLSATTFVVKQGATAVAGAVATSADGTIGTFAPSAAFAAGTAYTATITAGAKSAAANGVAGVSFPADQSWSFTTGTVADTTAPVVTATNPAADATGVPINTRISATFTKDMDPLSITASTFTVKQGSTPVTGKVVYGPGMSATFTAASNLAPSTVFTATLSGDNKDLEGNRLASAFSWSFTTGTTASLGPAPVGLGAAGNFVILSKTGISTVPNSIVTGDIGVSPIFATAITGFTLTLAGPYATSAQLTGRAYAADYAAPTPSNLTTAVLNMQAAYTDAAGRPTPDHLELGTGNIGGKTLAPGLYKWTSTVIIPTDVTLSGGANDVWIFQTTGNLTMAGAKNVILSGGAQAKNIFWEVAGNASFGAGAHFEGILLCKTDVTLQTGSSMNGRILSQTAVALQKATVTKPQ